MLTDTGNLEQYLDRIAEDPSEVVHEPNHFTARRRLVPTDRYVLLGAVAEFFGQHLKSSFAASAHDQHRRWGIHVEVSMELSNEVGGSRLVQTSAEKQIVYFPLNTNMRSSLHLEISPVSDIEVVSQGSVGVTRSRVVPFDQIAVVAAHDRHEIGESSSRSGMDPGPQDCGALTELDDVVREGGGQALELTRFYPPGRL